MTVIKEYHEIAAFQQIHAVNGMYSSSVCDTFRGATRRKVRRHDAARRVMVIVMERPGQRAAVCFIDVVEIVTRIHNLIPARVKLLVQVVVQVQTISEIGFSMS